VALKNWYGHGRSGRSGHSVSYGPEVSALYGLSSRQVHACSCLPSVTHLASW